MELCKDNLCTGCCSCMNTCPKDAIAMKENVFKAVVPVINNNLCVECGLCRQACPIINVLKKAKTKKCLAAWSKSNEIIRTSASSGIVTTLSRLVISKGGVVFGTRYTDKKLVFDYSEDYNNLKAFQGSKYVHALIGNTYSLVKEFLNNKKLVLFVGTPCQIAGLKRFLNTEFDNLITIDLICHGVTPNEYLNEYLDVVTPNGKFDKVLFRGEHGNKIVAYYDDKIVYAKNKLADLFYSAYAKGIMHRENCYSCQFSSLERIGDITAGDFWGIQRNKLKGDSSKIPYISIVLLNTEKGEKFFNSAKELIYSEERDIQEALDYNMQLKQPCTRHKDRDVFLDGYMQQGIIKSLRKTSIYREVVKNAILYKCINALSRLKRKIIR